MKWLVYFHYRLDTGECFYIGKGTEKRSREKWGRNEIWNRITKKTKYKIVIADRFHDEQDALDYEVALIAKYSPKANISAGGEAGFTGLSHSEETKQDLSEKILKLRSDKQWVSKNYKAMKAAVAKPESKAKISKVKKEFFQHESNRQHMSCMQKKFRREHPERELERQRKSQEARQTKEFRIKAALAQGGKPFVMIKDGAVVAEFVVLAECSRTYNLHSAAIHRCLKGKQKEHKGYEFKYKEAA